MRARIWALVVSLVLVGGMREASAGILYAINDESNTLVTIDRTTYAVTTVGSTGITAGDFGDLTYNSSNGKLYWIAGRFNNSLYTLDKTSGAATLVGEHGIPDLFALAYNSSDGKLYAQSTSNNVYTLDLITAAATQIGSNLVYPGGMAYLADTDQLILLESGLRQFYKISTSTGAATLLGGSGVVNDNGVTYDPELDAYFSVDWSGDFFKYDASTFVVIDSSTLPGSFDGVAYVPDQSAVPEPASMAIWGLGALGCAFVGYRRRKLAA